MKILNNLTEEEMKELLTSIGMEKYRGDQIFRGINGQKIENVDSLNQISKKDREKLKSISTIKSIEIEKIFRSKIDETVKLLYKLEDGYLIEGVLMKYKHGYSLCVSTQVGCRMGCSFCASTKDGLIRDLDVYEIVSQVYKVEEYFDIKLSNIVLMGSGEPLDNYNAVKKGLKILNSPKGRNISLRSITLSTCGIPERIIELGNDLPQIGLAISLHSLNQDIREGMMPIARAYPVDDLLNSVRKYEEITNNRVSFEYTVIPGTNNRKKDIKLIKDKLGDINYIINLIALNPIGDYNKSINYNAEAIEFKNNLERENINVTLRRELGRDISASCGQLKQYYQEKV